MRSPLVHTSVWTPHLAGGGGSGRMAEDPFQRQGRGALPGRVLHRCLDPWNGEVRPTPPKKKNPDLVRGHTHLVYVLPPCRGRFVGDVARPIVNGSAALMQRLKAKKGEKK